jgi:hypothetical protein
MIFLGQTLTQSSHPLQRSSLKTTFAIDSPPHCRLIAVGFWRLAIRFFAFINKNKPNSQYMCLTAAKNRNFKPPGKTVAKNKTDFIYYTFLSLSFQRLFHEELPGYRKKQLKIK